MVRIHAGPHNKGNDDNIADGFPSVKFNNLRILRNSFIL